jgi:hypothetical protein
VDLRASSPQLKSGWISALHFQIQRSDDEVNELHRRRTSSEVEHEVSVRERTRRCFDEVWTAPEGEDVQRDDDFMVRLDLVLFVRLLV